MTRRSFATFLFVIAITLPFDGCLIATQSFNHGKLLNPGERMFTTGFGFKRSTHYFKRFDDVLDTGTWESRQVPIPDSIRCNWFTFVLDYRAGVLRKCPFGRGLEIGYHIETASRGYYRTGKRLQIEFFSPPLIEIETRFGFSDVTLARSIFHHNMSLGWITGAYVDNGWFAGYTAGWEYRRFTPFIGSTLMLTATDRLNQPDIDENDFFTKHDRKLVCRISGGVSIRLPANYTFFPEYLSPECSLIFPHYADFQPVGFTAAVGVRWLLGQ